MTRCSKISITAFKCNSQKCLCAKCYHCTVFLHTSRSLYFHSWFDHAQDCSEVLEVEVTMNLNTYNPFVGLGAIFDGTPQTSRWVLETPPSPPVSRYGWTHLEWFIDAWCNVRNVTIYAKASVAFYLRDAMLIARSLPSKDVRLSITRQYCVYLVASSFCFFSDPCGGTQLQGEPRQQGAKHTGWKNFAIFDRNRRLSRAIVTIERQ